MDKILEVEISETEKNKRERSSNFSQEETDLLVSLAAAKKHIIESKKSDAATWQAKEKAWEDIELSFNSYSTAVFRGAKHLKLKYEGLKRDIRKKSAGAKRFKDGDGTGTAPVLTRVEQKVKEIMEGYESSLDSDFVLPSESEIQIQAEKQQMEWNPTIIKTENPCLSALNEKKTISKLITREKIEIAHIQKKIAAEELRQKHIQTKILEQELEHKRAIYQLEKQHLLLKIELLKQELENE